MIMGVVYKGDDLLRASDTLKSNVITWDNLVYAAYEAMRTAYQDDTWKGQAAERFKGYYEDIHASFAAVYFQLTEIFNKKCTAYVSEYLKVDTDNHAVIYTDELADVITHIVFRIQGVSGVHNAVSTQVSNVSDITSIYYADPGIVSWLGTMKGKVEKLQQAVWDEETNFVSDGFPRMKELLDSLRKLINGGNTVKVSSDNRTIAYDPNALQETFKDVAAAYESSQDYLDANAIKFAEDEKTLQNAIDQRQEELNRRKALAIGVGVVIGVIGVAVTVVTCGAAGPVATIAIGAAVGAVSGAATSVANQNVGDIYGRGKISIKEVGKEAVIGGITGAVTSATGPGSAKAVAATANCAHPVAAKVAIKAGESVVNGIVNRGVSTGIREENIGAGFKAAFDGNKILGDAAGSAASTLVGQGVDSLYKKTGIDQKMKDSKVADYAGTIVKDQVTDASKRFTGTLAETRDVKAAWDKTADLEAAGKTLTQSVVSKASENYITNRENKKDAAGMSAEKQQAVKDKVLEDNKAIASKRYDERVAKGSTPSRSKNHYVNKYGGRHAKEDMKNPEIVDKARQDINKDIAKGGSGRAKGQAGKAYDNISGIAGEEEYQAPTRGDYDIKQEDKDNLLNYNH